MTQETVEGRLRRFLLLLTLFIFAGTVAELLLEDHTQEALQFVPFILCALGFIAVMGVLLRPQRSTLLVLRVVMIIVGAGGVVGSLIHLLRNIAFEQEIRPNAALMDAILAGFKGASPLFAPGLLTIAALLALAATY